MGYMRHHAIVVTSWTEPPDGLIASAHARAEAILPGLVSPIIPSRINGYSSFFIAPDGSKEGWDESVEGDTQRDELIAWLDAQRYADGSTSLDWIEVQFGDEEGESVITRHSDEPKRKRGRG